MATTKTTKLPKPRLTKTARAALSLTINFGRNNTDTAPTPKTLSWDDLVKQFSVPDTKRGKLPLAQYLALDKVDKAQKEIRNHEKNGPYFIAGTFSKAGTRSASDIAFMCGFTGDIDTGKVSRATLEATFAGTKFLAYSSYSHSPDLPKWRFFIPYSRPVTKAEHEKVYAFLQKTFDNQLDTRCKTTAQLWYTPACPPDAAQYYEFFTGDGELLDPDTVPVVIETKQSKNTPPAVVRQAPIKSLSGYEFSRLNSALDAIDADDRDVWIRIGLALRHELGAETGYPVWVTWSKKSDKFDEDDAERTWNSFKDTVPEVPVTLGTIFFLAKENGWIDSVGIMHDAVRALDDKHFMAFEGGKSWVFKEDFDVELNRPVLTRLALRAFTDFYANQKVEVLSSENSKGKKTSDMVSVAVLWHANPARRSFERIAFLPELPTPQGCYNLWRGFPYPPIQGDWSLLKRHIFEVICDSYQACFDYLLNWMAYAIQYPDRLGEVAIVMRGERGTGKGKLAQLFSLLFGEHALQITQAKHLIGNFNAHLRTCVFLFVDEAIWAGDKEGENVLKALITEPTIQIEKKHVDATVSRNRLHIMMASNNDWVVPAGNRERRYCVLQVNDLHIQDSAYFAAIDDQMLNQGGLSAMMYDLKHRELSAFNVRKFPWTDALDDQILRTLDPADQWWMDHLGEVHTCWEFQMRKNLNVAFANAQGTFNEKPSQTRLGLFLKKMVPGGVKRVPHVFSAGHPAQDCYQFPSQQKCQQKLMEMLGLKKDPWL